MSVRRRPALVGLAGKGVELLTLIPLVTVLPRFPTASLAAAAVVVFIAVTV